MKQAVGAKSGQSSLDESGRSSNRSNCSDRTKHLEELNGHKTQLISLSRSRELPNSSTLRKCRISALSTYHRPIGEVVDLASCMRSPFIHCTVSSLKDVARPLNFLADLLGRGSRPALGHLELDVRRLQIGPRIEAQMRLLRRTDRSRPALFWSRRRNIRSI